jgi:DNA-damage-inducible protein D
MEQNNKIALFQEKQIRRVWHKEEWWFSIIDVIEVLTENTRPRKYWNDLKKKLLTEGYAELSENIGQLKMPSADGKNYKTDVANTRTMLRLIMSIPSPKAEPFKQWLAQVGQERIEEIENPEIGFERLKELYKSKGYSDLWIDARIKSIETRKGLTDEWKNREVKEGQEYAILTAEIAKATFGLTPSEHKTLKNLDKQNLRDHMTRLELIFTMLGEESTRQIAVENNSKGFNENREAAIKGGRATGNARITYEKSRNVKVVSSENFINQVEDIEKRNQLPDDTSEDTSEKI